MYSPTTRLLTVLELLQSYKQMSGTELARRLQVDPRTVRRYIVQLQDMGIPVEAERGPYGAYQIERGFKLPPLMFTDSEAVALTLGLLAIREFHFPVSVAAVEGALAKTERVMPDKLLHQARALQEAITFSVAPPPVRLENDFVVTLSSAVRERQRVHMRYQSGMDAITERDIDPYGIVFHEGYWYTAGWCHLRGDLRTFRIDRIVTLEPVEGVTFAPPDDFDALHHVLESLAAVPGTYQVAITLDMTMDEARERIPIQYGTLEEAPRGVVFRRQTQQLPWVAHILLEIDAPILAIEPPELCDILRDLAARWQRLSELPGNPA